MYVYTNDILISNHLKNVKRTTTGFKEYFQEYLKMQTQIVWMKKGSNCYQNAKETTVQETPQTI